MSLSRELAEAVGKSTSYRITPKERKAINDALRKAGADGNGRFKSIGQALNAIHGVLNDAGFEWGQVTSADLFRDGSGRRQLDIAKRTSDPFSPLEVANTALSFGWTELRPDTYEVVAYVG